MTTYQTQFLNELAAGHDGPPIPRAKLAYFQERFRGRMFDFIISKFADEEGRGLTQAKLCRRINKDPTIVHRWLSAPSNLTLDSLSDLLIGITAEELDLSSSPLLHRPPVNYSHSDHLAETINQPKQVVDAASAKNAMFDVAQDTAIRQGQVEQKSRKSALCA